MQAEKLLQKWVKANLIDEAQAGRILEFERQQPSPAWGIFAIACIGVVVILTGLISVIAANWDEISTSVKLAVYFLSLSLLGAAAVRYRESTPALREPLLIAFALYVLAGIGLIGQIYHLESDGYQALFFWLVLILPVTFFSRAAVLSHIWCAGFVTALCLWSGHVNLRESFWVVVATPYLFLTLGYGLGHVLPLPFTRTIRIWSYAGLLIPLAIMGNIGWASYSYHHMLERTWVYPLLAMLASVCAVWLRAIQPGKFLTIAIAGTLVASAALIIFPYAAKLGEHDIVGCALFLLAWAGAAAIAAAIERKRLFDLAALVICIRFIVVYFEVFGSLAATGLGLMISGLVILGIACMWHRYRRKIEVLIREAAV